MAPTAATIVSVTPLALNEDSRTLKQAYSLAAANYRSLVVAAGTLHEVLAGQPIAPSKSSKLSAPSVTHRRWGGLRTAELPWIAHAGLYGAWLALYGLRSVVRPLWRLPRANLYILHECSAQPAVALRARMAGVPYLYDAHDFYSRIEPDGALPIFDRRFVAPFVRGLESRAFKGAAASLTVSDGLALVLREAYPWVGDKLVVVRNAHDGRLDRPVSSALRSHFGLDDDSVVLATVGNAKRGQAQAEAIATLIQLPQHVHWVFIGAGYEPLLDAARAAGVETRVHLTGRLAPDAIVPTLRGADIAIVLYHAYSDNYRHALPNGLFQGIAAGLPHVLPPLAEISSLARDFGFAIEADPKNPHQMAVAIMRLVADRRLKDQFAIAAQAASTTLSWAVEERAFLALVASHVQP